MPEPARAERNRMKHTLKTWPKSMHAMMEGRKRFEYRKDDRGFAVGDTLVLLGYDPDTKLFTGAALNRRVQFIIHGGQFGIPAGYCIMDLVEVTPQEVLAD